jgi:hypothetical protein
MEGISRWLSVWGRGCRRGKVCTLAEIQPPKERAAIIVMVVRWRKNRVICGCVRACMGVLLPPPCLLLCGDLDFLFLNALVPLPEILSVYLKNLYV